MLALTAFSLAALVGGAAQAKVVCYPNGALCKAILPTLAELPLPLPSLEEPPGDPPPLAAVGESGQEACVSVTTPATAPPDIARLIAFFEQDSITGEVAAMLDTLTPGDSVFVQEQFLRPRNPWRLGEGGAACGRLDDCAVTPPGHHWLTKPMAAWGTGPVLTIGDGTTEQETIYQQGRAAREVYTPTSPSFGTLSVAPYRNGTYLAPRRAAQEPVSMENSRAWLGKALQEASECR